MSNTAHYQKYLVTLLCIEPLATMKHTKFFLIGEFVAVTLSIALCLHAKSMGPNSHITAVQLWASNYQVFVKAAVMVRF